MLPRIIADAVAVARDEPLIERDDALFELVDKILLVRDDDHRRAELIDALEQAHDLQRTRGVQVARRLVGDDGAGVVDECAGDGHALLLAAGDLVGVAVGLFLKPDKLQHIGNAVLQLPRRRPHRPHGQRQVVPHGLIADQAEVLEDHADRPAHIGDLFFSDAAHGKAVDHHAAGGGHDLAGQELDDGGLTGAGGPHQKDEFSVVHGKGNAL